MKRNNFQISANFNLSEFECPCCGCVMATDELAARLESLRSALGRPIVVTSGYRCARRNAEVGGAAGSRHMSGRAADVSCPRAKQQSLCEAAKLCGFAKTLAYPERGFVHLEV